MSVDPEESDKKQNGAAAWAFALGAGTQLVTSVLLGFLAGQWLDGKLGTGPWLMLLGAFLGISVGLYQLIKAQARRDGR
ncbi:MAG: AtpZ/AtpI family protein [Elusimicrobia bacterium]|nr:AtpZ/AtpI family protein [Elusimicrobiota bacterium]